MEKKKGGSTSDGPIVSKIGKIVIKIIIKKGD